MAAGGELFRACRFMRAVVREVFLTIREERSPDVLIADPDLNLLFLEQCRLHGLSESSLVLNLCLLNLRKSGALKGIKSKRTIVKRQHEFRFASEIAIRFLERRDQVSLDHILCDPARAAQFDEVALEIAPGFKPFEYRWAALNLRKRKKLRPEILARVVPPDALIFCKIEDLKIEDVPARPGLYMFLEKNGALYVGECQNLRKRIGKHLDHSDNKGLARWLWQHGALNLHLEYHVLPAEVNTRIRKAMEEELIGSRKPIFNIAGVHRSNPV
jgi:hypothetical protein